ncbi:MAG: hypothetical protein ABI370_14085 [Gammaproteobacteria bacterium]
MFSGEKKADEVVSGGSSNSNITDLSGSSSSATPPPSKRPKIQIIIPIPIRPGRPATPGSPRSPISPFSPQSSSQISLLAISPSSSSSLKARTSSGEEYTPVFQNLPTFFPLAPSPQPAVKGPRRMSTPKTPQSPVDFELAFKKGPIGIIQQLRAEMMTYKCEDAFISTYIQMVYGPSAMNHIIGLNKFNSDQTLHMKPEGAAAITEAMSTLMAIVEQLKTSSKTTTAVTTSSSSSLEQKPVEEKATHPAGLVGNLTKWILDLMKLYCDMQEQVITVKTLLELYARIFPSLALVVQGDKDASLRMEQEKEYMIGKLYALCGRRGDGGKYEESIQAYLDPKALKALLDKNDKTINSLQQFDLTEYPIEIIFNAFMNHAPEAKASVIDKEFKNYRGKLKFRRNDAIILFNHAMEKNHHYGVYIMSYVGILWDLKIRTQPGKVLCQTLQGSLLTDEPANPRLVEKFYKTIELYKKHSKEFTSDPRSWFSASSIQQSSASSSSSGATTVTNMTSTSSEMKPDSSAATSSDDATNSNRSFSPGGLRQ